MDITSVLVAAALVAGIAIGFIVAWKIVGYKKELEFRSRMEKGRAESVKMSRASLTGRISEQLAPFLPDFEYDPTEARFIGSPVDFVVFKGLSGHNVEEVIFVEVKSGAASLTQTERSLRDAIKARRVSWEEYHAPLPTAET